ncbi:signal peptidase II [bacterium]|nr:signal peptidase II [bacterium]
MESADPKAKTPEQEQDGAKAVDQAPGMWAHWPLCLGILVGGLAVDQLSKIIAKSALEPTSAFEPFPTVSIIPGLFQLRYAENTGAAFSMLTGNVGLLALISVCAAAGLTYWWTRLPAKELLGRAALSMVVAGAVGNLIDRALRGYVVDFFDAYWRTSHFPVFNVADSMICIGVGVLLLRTWQGKL